MAGTDPSGQFNSTQTRDALRAVMLTALPDDETLRPIFHFPRERTYAVDDHHGLPYDWTEAPATDTNDDPGEPRIVTCGPDEDQVLCVWEGAGGRGGSQSNETPFGNFDIERINITMLDVDRAKIDGFEYVVIGRQTFTRQFEIPAIGLYDLIVYQIVVQALDAHVNAS